MDKRVTRTRKTAGSNDAWATAAGPSKSTSSRVPPSKSSPVSRRGAPKHQIEDEDVVTDAASEVDEEVLMEEVDQQPESAGVKAETNEGGESEDSDSDDDSDEGTYFIDPAGNYYYQATPDSEPVLTEPPKGEYVPEEGDKEDAADDGFSYVMVVDDNATTSQIPEGVASHEEPSPGKQIIYQIADGKNILIEEEEEQEEDEQDTVKQEQKHEPEDEDDDGDEEYLIEEDIDLKVKRQYVARRGRPPKEEPKDENEEEEELSCNYCTYTTTRKHLLSRHLKCHNEERPHMCLVCERGFKTSASLQNHVNTHTGAKPHKCKSCDSAFATSGELVRHNRYKHTLEKPHKCRECDYASVELSKLKRHERCHTGERPYQCPHCTYASPDMFKLKRHLRTHTGEKPYVCDVCNARFTQSNSLKAHKLIHNVEDKPVFQCDFCPTSCGRKADLRIHVQKLHSSDQPLPCKKCSAVFPDRYSYKLHQKTHEGEKCYKCGMCDYKAGNARHLESHMLVHTNEKPFQCEQCQQCFRQRQLLKRHENIYHNPGYVAPAPKPKAHVCPTCDKQFHHKGNLLRHMTTHDPNSSVHEEQKRLKKGRKIKVEHVTEFMDEDDGIVEEDEEGEEEEEEEEEDEYEDVGDGGVVMHQPIEMEETGGVEIVDEEVEYLVEYGDEFHQTENLEYTEVTAE